MAPKIQVRFAEHKLTPVMVATAALYAGEDSVFDPLKYYSIRTPENPNWSQWEQKWPLLTRIRTLLPARLQSELGISFHLVPIPYDPIVKAYWRDYAWDYASMAEAAMMGRPPVEVLANGLLPSMMVGELLLNAAGTATVGPEISVQHELKPEVNRNALRALLEDFLGPAAVQWDGTDKSCMVIRLQ